LAHFPIAGGPNSTEREIRYKAVSFTDAVDTLKGALYFLKKDAAVEAVRQRLKQFDDEPS